ncbi:hypothetical protein EG829_32335 [bacterium]|nr:hypothetical protein [bacterium]
MNKDYDYLISFLEADRLNDQIHIIRNHEKIKIIIPQRTLFPTAGSAWLTPKGIKLVKKITRAVKQIAPLGIEIAGHTDSVLSPEAKSTYPTNWHLAHARAIAVLLVFEDAKIKKDIMTAVSYADARPIADASTDEGKAMNRRVEIVITP